MRVLVAFDKFKDSLSAKDACTVTAATMREKHRDWEFDLCPLADGGEGFCSILTSAAGGQLIGSSVHDPLGDSVQAQIGIVPLDRIPPVARELLQLPPPPASGKAPSTLAVIEMATASGLALLASHERDPWQTSTFGTGELIRTAADLNVAAVLLGVGGSATNDLGLCALSALGLDFVSNQGDRIDDPIPARWREINRISGSITPPIPPVRIACDVTNPLLGPRGAAATYGPQKGLHAADLPRLDHESARLALLLCNHYKQPDSLMETPGAGAAGGISFGFMAATGAKLLPGFELVSAWLNLEARLAAADLVITGEGRFDETSLNGKGPGAVAARALTLGKAVHVFAGNATIASPRPNLSLHSITPAGTPLEQALRQATLLLRKSVADAF